MSNPTTKEEAAYQAIRSAIIDGELKPGQSVTIRDLASRFDLGRTPITDAMKHLALDGWLETTTGVGTQVANLNLADRFSYMQVCGAIEALAVRLCAENVTQEDLLALDHCLAVAKLAIDSGNLVRAIEADIDFHRLCAKCSKNRFLYQFYDRLLTQDELVFFRNVSDADIRIQSHEQHAAIVEAIRSGNPQQAEEASATTPRLFWIGSDQKKTILNNAFAKQNFECVRFPSTYAPPHGGAFSVLCRPCSRCAASFHHDVP